MMKNMKPAQRIYAVFNGEMPDRTPFSVYECMIQGFPFEQEIRQMGACVVQRISTARVDTPGVAYHSEPVHYRGRDMWKNVISTPEGDLYTITEPAGFTTWTHEHLFKSPDDYKKMAAFYGSMKISANYGAYADLVKIDRAEEDIVVRDNLQLEPMQRLIHDMGTMAFCYEWMDNRDEILKLYQILRDKAREMYPVIAQSPFRFHNYGGNVTPPVIGREIFEQYYVPVYNEACEVFHRYGKKIGSHLDADNTVIMDLVNRTELDYIEAFDPGVGPSVADAMSVWKNKVLWIHWPSAWQYHTEEEIIADTQMLIGQADPARFIIGITEDIPPQIQRRNLAAILKGIQLYER